MRSCKDQNWAATLMFGLLYPAVLGTFLYSLLPETLQALRAPLQIDTLQGTKLVLSFLLIAHFLVDFYLTQQVALESKEYPPIAFVLDVLVVLALFVAYDTVHLGDNGQLELRWAAGAMFVSYVIFWIWAQQMKSNIGKTTGLSAYEIGSAAAFLLVATVWPNAFAVVLFVSAVLMWFVGGSVVEDFRLRNRDGV
jgi:hypothetical protein